MANYCRKMEQKYELKQVLNPRRYLSKEQRKIPRFDQRKERLRLNIKEALKGCSNMAQFEQKMKERGYESIRCRGISFADEKKVKVKGSEVNYSLQTIEKILAQQRTFQGSQQTIKPSEVLNHEPLKTAQDGPGKDLKESLLKIFEGVIKPERINEPINQNFLPKKRMKKKRYHL